LPAGARSPRFAQDGPASMSAGRGAGA
jgi:hypothetical protein